MTFGSTNAKFRDVLSNYHESSNQSGVISAYATVEKKSLGMILNTKKRIESHSEECREYVVMYLQLY